MYGPNLPFRQPRQQVPEAYIVVPDWLTWSILGAGNIALAFYLAFRDVDLPAAVCLIAGFVFLVIGLSKRPPTRPNRRKNPPM